MCSSRKLEAPPTNVAIREMEKLKVLFIGGEGRSGGTLLGQILGSIEPFVYVGELRNLWHETIPDDEPCGCGEPFSQCRFWQKVMERAFGEGKRVDLGEIIALHRSIARERYTPLLALFGWVPADASRAGLSRRYAELMARLYQAAAEVSGRSVVVDSSREASSALLLARIPSIELRVLHLIRDSRAVAYSFSRRKVQFDSGGNHKLLPQRSAWHASLHWMWCNAWISRLRRLEARGVMYSRLRYEDLVSNPRIALSDALADLGFGNSNLVHINGQCVQLGNNHAISANPVKFDSGKIELRHDDEWCRAMHEQNQRVVTLLTSPLIRRYGYRGSEKTSC